MLSEEVRCIFPVIVTFNGIRGGFSGDKNIFLSSRNLKKARVILASELNTYDVMNANKLMITESSISEIEKNF